MEALATWQNRTLCKMTSTHQGKEIRVTISVSDLAKKVAGHQGLQLQKVFGPDEKL